MLSIKDFQKHSSYRSRPGNVDCICFFLFFSLHVVPLITMLFQIIQATHWLVDFENMSFCTFQVIILLGCNRHIRRSERSRITCVQPLCSKNIIKIITIHITRIYSESQPSVVKFNINSSLYFCSPCAE